MPRLAIWIVITIGLLAAIWLISPLQLPVVLYKAALVTLGAVLGYWLDRSLFPYARPHQLFANADLEDSCGVNGRPMRESGNFASIRRALVVVACVLGLTLGL